MSIKEETIRELESLEYDDVRIIYDIIQSLKRRTQTRQPNGNDYLKVREALRNISGSLSEDICNERADRI